VLVPLVNLYFQKSHIWESIRKESQTIRINNGNYEQNQHLDVEVCWLILRTR
jgi:4-hydroxy-3-methylbut-2-en-1-yl diphosphate synthase IspG/GcpE